MTAQRYRYEPSAAPDILPVALQVFGVGMRIAHHPARDLWALVEAGGGRLIEQPAPPGSLRACQDEAALWRRTTLGDVLRYWPAGDGPRKTFVENYPVPAVLVGPTRWAQAAASAAVNRAYFENLVWSMQSSGLPFHRLSGERSTVSWETGNDNLWTAIFQRFDKAGDLNSLLLWAEDGYAMRAQTGGWQAPPSGAAGAGQPETLQAILSRDRRASDLSDAFVSLLLGRHAAAEWLRELAPHVVDSVEVTQFPDGRSGRGKHGFGGLGRYNDVGHTTYRSPRTYTRTPHVPEPWSQAQMAQYDETPTLAWVYRPAEASYSKVEPQAQRVAALQQALQSALDGPLQGQPPARIMFDPGVGETSQERMLVLRQAVRAVLPAFALHDPRAGYHLGERLGDCGAASAFAGIGLASLAAWETGASAIVINARRDDGATVLVVQPNNPAYRAHFRKRPYEHA
ncbi:hypothetical protein RD110_00280 [Rhodoferax koreense]|uniref:Type VI lipase adapter protein Tla3 C-terminal domain-containing protein n=1 Tax=Rhodoferax koreensis TaxID=1842727 RepID=A0A1P8JQ22_9BURK|nr:DUF2875 family protein [Rhodoferax koreense]APW35843.1 hypothetical protein RD110_00280 [Rhodoferax koreense]